MSKVKATEDELRPEYKRSDFSTMVRGKYVPRFREGYSITIHQRSDEVVTVPDHVAPPPDEAALRR
jgi:hypothetical protein